MAERVRQHGVPKPLTGDTMGEGGHQREGLPGLAAALASRIREVVRHPARGEDLELSPAACQTSSRVSQVTPMGVVLKPIVSRPLSGSANGALPITLPSPRTPRRG